MLLEEKIVYKAKYINKFSAKFNNLLLKNQVSGISFYSSQAALTFVNLILKFGLQNQLKNIKAWNLSDQISSVISYLNWKDVLISKNPTQQSMLDLIKETY